MPRLILIRMNKVSGYKAIKLKDGSQIELKFGMGALELFAEAVGVKTLDEALKLLNPENDPEGNPIVTFAYLGIIRKLLFAAAKFAALTQNKPVDFNEYTAANWLEEVGIGEILSVLDLGGETPKEVPAETKKKQKPLIKATQ